MKEFLLKDVSGRGYTRNMTEQEALDLFAGYTLIDQPEETMESKIEGMDIGEIFDCGEIDAQDNEFTATKLIRTK